MDVGIILIRPIDDICWKQLEDPQFSIRGFSAMDVWYSNVKPFCGEPKRQSIHQALVTTLPRIINSMALTLSPRHDLFLHFWKDHTNPGGIIQIPLVDFAKQHSFEDSQAMNYRWE
jgi:hypothetical protein